MGRVRQRIKRRKRALRRLEEVYDKAEYSLVVHYSCEHFYERPNGESARITSIAVRNLDSGQTESFSIHKIAEQENVPSEKITEKYDELEKAMLKEFYGFVEAHQGYHWVHWNMRDINYGFPAIEHRCKVLCVKPIEIKEYCKFDLARALVSIYGCRYAPHQRLANLLKMNKIKNGSFLTGEQEAEAFCSEKYVKLHQSTLAKVDMMANIFGRAVDGTLKTNAKWSEIHGFTPEAIGELMKEHWIFSILSVVVVIIALLEYLL